MTRALLTGLGVVLFCAGAPLDAQQLRVTSASTLRYIELRPLVRDSIPAGEVGGEGLLRTLPDGRAVRCVPDDAFCRYTQPGDAVAALPLIQDVEASAWGFAPGVRIFGQLRARTGWGSGAALWPQADDALDLVAAYAELERTRYRVRLGRQWQVSSLGFYNFDGLNAGIAPATGVWAEAYAGRSLIRGAHESRASGALESVEEHAPAASGLLTGAHVRYRHSARLSAAAAYQVEFRTDGAGLYSELAAASAFWQAPALGSVDAALEVDVANAALNEVRLQLRSRPVQRFVLHTELRRYRPWFELWTIWGAFSPVGFDEARAGASWTADRGSLLLRAEAAYRRYGDAGSSSSPDRLRDDGWGAVVAAIWSPAPGWHLDAGGRVEAGFGSARRDGHAGVTRAFGDRASMRLQTLAFQRLHEFRLAEGTVIGAMAELALRLHDRAQLHATGAAYRHGGDSANGLVWNQRRGSVRLEWTIGAEPVADVWRRPGER
jgi:hypothetical protein